MAVGDSHGHPEPVCQIENIATVMLKMAVDDVVWTIFSKDLYYIVPIGPWPMWMRARDDLGPKGAGFVAISVLFSGVDQEIHMEPLSVNVTQDMHEPGFESTPIHPANNMEYLYHCFSLYMPF